MITGGVAGTSWPPSDPLISFLVNGLRGHGVAVSPAEVLDAHRALRTVGVAERSLCLAALRATLVKQAAHDILFDLLVQALQTVTDELFPAVAERAKELATAVAFDGEADEAPALPDEAERVRVSDGRDDAADGEVGEADDSADPAVRSSGFDGIELAEAGADAEADRQHHRVVLRQRSHTELDLPLADRLEVERVARVFLRAHRHDARRWAPALRGRIDMRRTLRSARRTGGVPMVVHRRARSRRSPRVVVLADVSISVRSTARLALHAADALTRRARGVRLLVFVDHAVDATAIVRRLPPGAVVAELVDGGVVDVGAASDYGAALRSAHDRIGPRINRATTIIVFGDGRGNGADPGFDVIERWCRIARSVVWCTPEPRGAWRLGFGEMQGYADRVGEAHTVRSVDDLASALAS